MRSWFTTTLGELATYSPEAVAAQLARQAAIRNLDQNRYSVTAWEQTVSVLQRAAGEITSDIDSSVHWHVGFEFELPRRRRRIDAIVLADDLIFVLELKAGHVHFDSASKWQVEQYALDMRDFHAGSAGHLIVPVLVPTAATRAETPNSDERHEQTVFPVQCVPPSALAGRMLSLHTQFGGLRDALVSGGEWEDAPYRPTPSIIEAARDLYASHDVRDIAASGAQNLHVTVDAVVELVERCQAQQRRGIAFITGAPGSGKTLAGLQVVHDERLSGSAETAGVFLSGNMPLVEVITAALGKSNSERRLIRRPESQRRVSTFIQHAYAFRNEYAEHPERVPHEHVVLFDEAQRAWDAERVMSWTHGDSNRSEPRILLDVMNRLPNWSVVIAMVGGGQEINSGEAGLAEWGRALEKFHPDWIVMASPAVLPGSDELPGGPLFDALPSDVDVRADARLHLDMNVRSPRAEKLNRWVDSLLALNISAARDDLPDQREFPMVLTRDLRTAKDWLRDRIGSDDSGFIDQRCGLVANSAAKRLRAWGLDTSSLRKDKAWADWFLRDIGDVRSSFQLEVPATNFDCQGLELDWVGVCWGNDLTFDHATGAWRARTFRGNRWMGANSTARRYIINSYRVLLTRARRGQVIWVPNPDGRDATLEPEFFDSIAELLLAAGAHPLP